MKMVFQSRQCHRTGVPPLTILGIIGIIIVSGGLVGACGLAKDNASCLVAGSQVPMHGPFASAKGFCDFRYP
jgi:hypothetical protein